MGRRKEIGFMKIFILNKLRLKNEFKYLKKYKDSGVIRYDLNTSEIIKTNKNNDISSIKEKSPRMENESTISKNRKGIPFSLRRYGKGHIEAISHLNTTVSALGIYTNPLPALKRRYS